MAEVKRAETTAEGIFREFYGPTAFIEKAAIPLKHGFTSKKLSGNPGFPDFFRDNGSWLIVVEAKPGTPGPKTSHAAAQAEVQHYMTENTVDPAVDIVGIAVSGQTRESLDMSYYIALAPALDGGTRTVQPIPGFTAPASLDEIMKRYLAIRNGDPLEDAKLTVFLRSLNERFHKNSRVRDTERSLFFSALMIALDDDNFRGVYKVVAKPADRSQVEAYYLNTEIVNAVKRQLDAKINNQSKQLDWGDRFSFIKTIDIPLVEYKQIITSIDDSIHKPSKQTAKRDILGKAYKIFLSRAGKMDNKNIILTPDHVKTLMVDLAGIERRDVVLDTCTGSGGFLMEAMERLLAKAHGDESEIKNIHEHQLIGMENDPVLFALACSNMFLHGDGRSNMLYRDSLVVRDRNLVVSGDETGLRDYIRSLGPTKAIINPPYEQDNPILFTISALEYLKDGGSLVIIMPVNTLSKANDKTLDRIFATATLDYLIEMPGQLFFEQGRGVKTAIFGFTKKPHDKARQVLFVDLTDDGHKVRQGQGRVDTGAWPAIKEDARRAVLNHSAVDGLSWTTPIHDGTGWVPAGVVHNPYRTTESGDLNEAIAAYIEATATRQQAQDRMYAVLTETGIEGFDE
jgi:type I restriction enzyme M protein